MKRSYQIAFQLFMVTLGIFLFFQNCSQPGQIVLSQSDKASLASSTSGLSDGGSGTGGPINLEVCEGISCTLDPITTKPAVTTILLALGDEANNQLVINGNSSQLIAETVIRYTSPKSHPKILVIQDQNIGGEDPEDTKYVTDVLLARYQPAFLIEPQSGLKLSDIENYDVVWFNNPGHPMTSKITYEVLLQYKGGVVIQGDDLSRGSNFNMEELTHLKYIDNGGQITCGDKKFNIDNNLNSQYRISLDSVKFPSAGNSAAEFFYGNDIDLSSVVSSDVEVLASAYGSDASCTEARPAIVRYLKQQ